MKTYITYCVQIFEQRTAEGILINNTDVIVVAKNEKEALAKADKLYHRKEYHTRIKSIVEQVHE